MSFTTPALAVLNNLPPTAKPPSPINTTAPSINTLNTQPIETKDTANYGKDLTTLTKIYTKKANTVERMITLIINL